MFEQPNYQSEFYRVVGGEYQNLVEIGRKLLDIAYLDFNNTESKRFIQPKYFLDIPGGSQAAWEIPEPPKFVAPDQIGVILAKSSLLLAIYSKRTAIHEVPSEPHVKVMVNNGQAKLTELDPVRPIIKPRTLDGESLTMFNGRLNKALSLFKLNVDEIELKQAS